MKKIYLSALALFSIALYSFAGSGLIEEKPKTSDTITVTATIYKPSCGTTTADGFRIKRAQATSHKLIAVSWDLRREYPFGTKVFVSNAGNLSGNYVVRDLMNPRFTKRIDILVNQNHKLVKYENVQLTRVVDSNQGVL